MQISLSPIKRIIPYSRNPRKNATAIKKVAASIKEFGFRQPIVVDKNMVVIAGHTRLLAASKLGLDMVPIHIALGLTDSQVKAYRLADNRTHEDAEWNEELLKIELENLKENNFDLEITGFDPEELEVLLNLEKELTEENLVPDIPSVPVSKLGDLWILGKHKLLCGDALEERFYTTLLGSTKADMIFTDPPYNVNYSGTLADRTKAKTTGVNSHNVLNDNLKGKFYDFLLSATKLLVRHSKGAIYISMAASELDTLRHAFREAGGHWSTFIIWAKNHFTLGGSDYQRQYEPIFYGWPKGEKRFWCGARNQADIWFFNKPNSSILHPVMKPVELVQKAIENSSKTSDIVLDAFAGAGSTLIACEKTNRIARLMELEPKYCDVIIRRWQDFTDKEAILSTTGKTFSDISNLKNTHVN